MRRWRELVMVTVLGLVLAGAASPEPAGAPKELKLENLLRQTLDEEFTPGREIVISYVEIPPNTTMERHWHPGEEFHYYLEGSVEIVIDGQPSIHGTPGTVGHVPYRSRHTAVTKDEGARALVFRVHTAGEPVRYVEGGGASDR